MGNQKNKARGQTKNFCCHDCHHKSMMSPICQDGRVVSSLFGKYRFEINRTIHYWNKSLRGRGDASKIEEKVMLAISQFPMTKSFSLPDKDRKRVFKAYIMTAGKHAFLDAIEKRFINQVFE